MELPPGLAPPSRALRAGRPSYLAPPPSAVSRPSKHERSLAMKDLIRITVEFVFTQVGVGGLVICYTIIGALAFQAIETEEAHDLIVEVSETRLEAVAEIWRITSTYNTLNYRQWETQIQKILSRYQTDLVDYVSEGYDEHTSVERWTFPAALIYTLSLITMIGFGDIVPRTEFGKVATIFYCVLGIPVYFLYFMNMGKVFADAFKWAYRKVHSCRHHSPVRELEEMDMLEVDACPQQVLVPSSACIWVMLVYLSLGTTMFAEWEGWEYLDSLYFVVTSLLKIGHGDFVPGTGNRNDGMIHAKLYANFFYLLFGMGVVAMNYHLLKEEVVTKARRVRRRLEVCGARSKGRILSSVASLNQ